MLKKLSLLGAGMRFNMLFNTEKDATEWRRNMDQVDSSLGVKHSIFAINFEFPLRDFKGDKHEFSLKGFLIECKRRGSLAMLDMNLIEGGFG